MSALVIPPKIMQSFRMALVLSELAAWQSSLAERRLDHDDDFGEATADED